MRVVLDINIPISALITKDNPVLAAAVAAKANLIVSGDKRHMLARDPRRRIDGSAGRSYSPTPVLEEENP